MVTQPANGRPRARGQLRGHDLLARVPSLQGCVPTEAHSQVDTLLASAHLTSCPASSCLGNLHPGTPAEVSADLGDCSGSWVPEEMGVLWKRFLSSMGEGSLCFAWTSSWSLVWRPGAVQPPCCW